MYNQRTMKIFNNFPLSVMLINGRQIFTTKDDETKKKIWISKGFKPTRRYRLL